MIAENFVEEMLGFCQRDDVGIVGARLLYEDDTIQHAGVVVGFGGIAGHTFIGLHKAEKQLFPPGHVRPGLQRRDGGLHDEQNSLCSRRQAASPRS